MTIILENTDSATALDREKVRLNHHGVSISHSARELALTADMFSERVRSLSPTPMVLQQIEGHLSHLRRNCADAQYMAETVRGQLESPVLTWHMTQACEETLNDAAVRLTLADFAYDRACELSD